MQLLVIQFAIKAFHTGFMQGVTIVVEISMFKIPGQHDGRSTYRHKQTDFMRIITKKLF